MQEVEERRKTRLRMSLSNLMEFEKELVHVIEDCLVKDPMKEFKKTRNAQIEMEMRLGGCACRQCRLIAKNLG